LEVSRGRRSQTKCADGGEAIDSGELLLRAGRQVLDEIPRYADPKE
jgi:hypothetical protein